MGKVVNLFDERWVVGVFDESGLRLDVSTKGNVRFVIAANEPSTVKQCTLSMEQMSRLGETLSIAYKEESDG